MATAAVIIRKLNPATFCDSEVKTEAKKYDVKKYPNIVITSDFFPFYLKFVLIAAGMQSHPKENQTHSAAFPSAGNICT